MKDTNFSPFSFDAITGFFGFLVALWLVDEGSLQMIMVGLGFIVGPIVLILPIVLVVIGTAAGVALGRVFKRVLKDK
jgi:hypothetical protein